MTYSNKNQKSIISIVSWHTDIVPFRIKTDPKALNFADGQPRLDPPEIKQTMVD